VLWLWVWQHYRGSGIGEFGPGSSGIGMLWRIISTRDDAPCEITDVQRAVRRHEEIIADNRTYLHSNKENPCMGREP
jgi:hypothetical protein